MSKVLGIIPARYASTRFPGKLLKEIAGKTLIQRTYENATQCTSLDRLIIATDDKRIYDHATDFGGAAVRTSPKCADGTERIIEVLQNGFDEYDLIVNVQGDEPCIDPETISKTIKILKDDNQAVMSTATTEIKKEEDIKNPSVVKCVFDKCGNALYFSRHPIPFSFKNFFHAKKENITYYRHIGLYCYRREFLLKYSQYAKTPLQQTESLEQLKILEHGYRIKVAVVEENSIDVNNPEDIAKVEEKLCHQNTFS